MKQVKIIIQHKCLEGKSKLLYNHFAQTLIAQIYTNLIIRRV